VTDPLIAAAKRAWPLCVKLRRDIHKHPELSTHEFATAQRVRKALSSSGVSSRLCCGATGVAAVIKNGKGKTVVLRADLDALPITENTGLPYSSVNKGVMHACGHDMHAACLVGAARVLQELRAQWRGTVVLLFQPTEEVAPGGAATMIKEGVFPSRVDAVFGLHVNPEHPSGIVGLKSGPDYAGVVDFDVVVKGRGGHAAMPQNAKDPLASAAAAIAELKNLVKTECGPRDPSVVTVGTMSAGTKNNIIPNEAFFGGTIRALSDTRLSFLMRRVLAIVQATARSQKARATITFEKSYPPGNNDPAMTRNAFRVLTKLLGKKKVVWRKAPTMLAEDFAYFQRKAPGVYAHLGVRPAGRKNVPGIHTPNFIPDERAMIVGIAVHAALAIDILHK
jgi:amidohydrolase